MTTKAKTEATIRSDTAKQYKRIRKILKDGLYKREVIKLKTEADQVKEEGRF